MKLYKFFFIFSFLFVPLTINCFGQNTSLDSNKIKDLKKSFFVEEFNGSPKPYIGQTLRRGTALILKTSLSEYIGDNLNVKAVPGLCLFINYKLIYQNISKIDTCVRLKIEEGYLNRGLKDIVTLYFPEKPSKEFELYIGNNQILRKGETKHTQNSIIERPVQHRAEIFMIIFLIIVFLFAMLKERYPKRFLDFYSLPGMVKLANQEENSSLNLYSFPSIVSLLINCLSLSLIFSIILRGSDRFIFPWLSENFSLFQSLFTITVFFFLFFLLKYVFLQFSASIFQLRQVANIQFFELIKISLRLNLLLLLLAIITFYSKNFFLKDLLSGIISYKVFAIIFLIAFLLLLLRISFLIFKISEFRNIYLFSYLCTTEVIPLVMLIKIISVQ